MGQHRQLDAVEFASLMRAGHANLQRHVAVVNALNVFPVPDGDTGTNMDLSMASGVNRLRDVSATSLRDVCQAFASGLLMGARGNSGVILSQLFRGFQKVAQNVDVLDTRLFAMALQEGVSIAYRAVAKPVEGTLLTVAREASAVGVRDADRRREFRDWMNAVLLAAQAALARTPDQLAILRESGVVDSGGQGFVFIIEGFVSFLSGAEDTLPSAQTVATHVVSHPAAATSNGAPFGYCTEMLLRVTARAAVASARLQEILAQYGDSLLVVRDGDLIKVHVHTLHPGQALEDGLAFGPIIHVKIDNMTEQHESLCSGAAALVNEGQYVSQDSAVVAVAAGDGLATVFASLGADIVVSGGQTMNPSTEEIVAAIQRAGGQTTYVLPNNPNIMMTAEQAAAYADGDVEVIPSMSIPQGLAALVAFQRGEAQATNVRRMREAMANVRAGQVVRASRDSMYLSQEITEGQYLGFVNQQLVHVGDERLLVALAVVDCIQTERAELLTIFYGVCVPDEEWRQVVQQAQTRYGIEVEAQCGGQPIYDYILSLE